MELLRNHVVTSAAVSSSHLPHHTCTSRRGSAFLILLLCPSQLDVFNLVSIPTVVTLANQVLTINVTQNVSVEVRVA